MRQSQGETIFSPLNTFHRYFCIRYSCSVFIVISLSSHQGKYWKWTYYLFPNSPFQNPEVIVRGASWVCQSHGSGGTASPSGEIAGGAGAAQACGSPESASYLLVHLIQAAGLLRKTFCFPFCRWGNPSLCPLAQGYLTNKWGRCFLYIYISIQP